MVMSHISMVIGARLSPAFRVRVWLRETKFSVLQLVGRHVIEIRRLVAKNTCTVWYGAPRVVGLFRQC